MHSTAIYDSREMSVKGEETEAIYLNNFEDDSDQMIL